MDKFRICLAWILFIVLLLIPEWLGLKLMDWFDPKWERHTWQARQNLSQTRKRK